MPIRLKRIYAESSPEDGTRILMDGLWPRGVSKERAQIDLWLRQAAPSNVLRKWFDHRPERWEEFKARYFAELEGKVQELDPLLAGAKEGTLTLLYSSREENFNNAVALKEYLEGRLE